MAAPAVLDPSKFSITLAGSVLSGFAPGTFIEISRDEDSIKDKAGADGEVARIRVLNKLGTCKLTLM